MILFEIHTKNNKNSWNKNWISCECSYCRGNNKLHYGLNIPEDKGWTSWYIIKVWKHTYIRFTLHYFKKYFDKIVTYKK